MEAEAAHRKAPGGLATPLSVGFSCRLRKNSLFAGSEGGAQHWAVLASLVETCKINAVEPEAYFADVITKLINGHLQSRLDELLPWAYAT